MNRYIYFSIQYFLKIYFLIKPSPNNTFLITENIVFDDQIIYNTYYIHLQEKNHLSSLFHCVSYVQKFVNYKISYGDTQQNVFIVTQSKTISLWSDGRFITIRSTRMRVVLPQNRSTKKSSWNSITINTFLAPPSFKRTL